MFERLARSWELVKASWSVLKADKELILFPIVSLLGTILVMIVFAVPTLLAGVFDQATNEGGIPVAGYIIGFLFYIVMYTVVIFSNVALVGAAMIRLNGGDPTVSDGFRIAFSKLSIIVQYAVISATVGMILRFLQERGGLLGSIVSWIGSVAWNVATFLVVPVLVVEDVNPIDAIKRSASLLKQTWGEQVVGNFSIGAITGLVTIAAIIIIGLPLLVLAAATESVILIVLAVAFVVLVVMAIGLVSSALSGIYMAAVYRYAVNGETSQYFRPELIEGAFRMK